MRVATGRLAATTRAPRGQQVYLYALGGDPGLGIGVNPAAGLMAALGACPAAGNFATATPYVVINEVSTVAAAYAFAGFATDATHVSSSGTALAQKGIANAFANAANLETLSTGVALAATPAGNGVVPQAEINTLANVLASCVNTNGAVTGPTNASACYTLFANATVDGTVAGTQPTDTATAAINIAHYPGTNVSALYGLAGGTPPFAPGLTRSPNDWTIALSFNTTALTANTLATAVDGQGDVWLVGGLGQGNPSTLAELSPTGAVLSGSGYSLNGYPGGLAIDPGGNVWAAMTNGGVYKVSSSSGVLLNIATTAVAGMSNPYGVAIDGNGDAWIGNYNAAGLFELGNDGTVMSPAGGFSTGSNAYVYPIAIDGSENVWVGASGGVQKYSTAGAMLSLGSGAADISTPEAIDGMGDVWAYTGLMGNGVVEMNNAGTLLSPVGGYGACNSAAAFPHACQGLFPGAVEPLSTAIDGAGNVWTPVAYYRPVTRTYFVGIAELSSGGTILSGSLGYQTSGSEGYYPSLLQVDGSGNLWGASPASVVELVGVAAPVVTPLAVGAKNNMLGTRP